MSSLVEENNFNRVNFHLGSLDDDSNRSDDQFLTSNGSSNYDIPKIVLSELKEEEDSSFSQLIGECISSPKSPNVSSSSFKLKGILKKPRSLSFSESTENYYGQLYNDDSNHFEDSRNSVCMNCYNSEETSDTCGSKKCVSFNNQVIRNVFKAGSTIVGMRKPHTEKNRKKNKRKRTLSDPCQEFAKNSEDELSQSGHSAFMFKNTLKIKPRFKSISESSDDNPDNNNNSLSNLTNTSDDLSYESPFSNNEDSSSNSNLNNLNSNNLNAQPPDAGNNHIGESNQKKKKRKRKKKNNNNNNNLQDCSNENNVKSASLNSFNMDQIVKEADVILNANN